MTALTANARRDFRDESITSVRVGASTTIFEGSLVMIKADGNAAPATPTADTFFAGVALDGIKTGTGESGNVRVHTNGVWKIASTGLAQTDVGSTVYITDDNEVTTTSGGNAQTVGKIVKHISATLAEVRIQGFEA